MSRDLSDQILIGSARERGTARFKRWGLIAVPLLAILFQVYVPRYYEFLRYLELPLLVTVYFALMRRSQIAGIFIGAGIGLVQDSLSPQPIGVFGLDKTLVGYFAASVGMRIDVEHVMIRFVLAFALFIFHQFFYWALARAFLGQQLLFDIQQTLIMGLLNAAVGVSLYHFLDKLKERG
jgi:rod shape-determining protein MreD